MYFSVLAKNNSAISITSSTSWESFGLIYSCSKIFRFEVIFLCNRRGTKIPITLNLSIFVGIFHLFFELIFCRNDNFIISSILLEIALFALLRAFINPFSSLSLKSDLAKIRKSFADISNKGILTNSISRFLDFKISITPLMPIFSFSEPFIPYL
ncbi:MAG: hypothetical protein C5S43_05775 [Candidatus Methanocomedens sp.]|nr:MAG: hypothetical protein C5S43_05775 [ANME-2 cluster archaeon]